MNLLILLAGLWILALLLRHSHDGDLHNAIAMGYFFGQMFPLMLLDLSAIKEFRLMRRADSRSTRKAELQPRRLSDYISSTMIGMAIITYVAFILLIIYVDQFGFPWFGGYLNIVIVTIMNIFFAGIVFWHMYGKKLNPHQASQDRKRRIETVVKIMVSTSIAATIFGALSIALSAWDVRHLLPIFLSMYLQLLAVFGFQAYRLDVENFDVYKDDSLAT